MELEEIPSEEMLSEDEALTFSAPFERKMKKLIRRADHPIRYRIVQAAACLLLAALLSGCTVLAVSSEARAAFVGWVREVYEEWFVYRYTGKDQTAPENVVYCPTWIAPRIIGILERVGSKCIGHSAQFSSSSPGTRSNSRTLFVTRIIFSALAWHAISISKGPIGVPWLCR